MSRLPGGLRTVALAGIISWQLFQGAARCEEAWRGEFDATCARTDEAMTLSLAELNSLLGRCDALQKIIETQDGSLRKVYLKRLQLCRNLYAYMVEYKKNEAQPAK